jgi:hypothetical protein
MPRPVPPRQRLAGAARWPFGLLLTSWSYIWRTTPIHRRELEGSWAADRPPEVTQDADLHEVQRAEDGSGRVPAPPLPRRGAPAGAIGDRGHGGDPGQSERRRAEGARAFRQDRRRARWMRVGDEFTVRMPGPWDGPVRVVDRSPASFRFITLDGHIEAGQIEWRAGDEDGRLVFEIESWSRPGDRLSDLMHHRLRMAKEVQLHMWTSVLEKVAQRYGGRRDGPLEIRTRVVSSPPG